MRLKTARAAIYTALIPVIMLIFQNICSAGLASTYPFLLLALSVLSFYNRYISALFLCSNLKRPPGYMQQLQADAWSPIYYPFIPTSASSEAAGPPLRRRTCCPYDSR